MGFINRLFRTKSKRDQKDNRPDAQSTTTQPSTDQPSQPPDAQVAANLSAAYQAEYDRSPGHDDAMARASTLQVQQAQAQDTSSKDTHPDPAPDPDALMAQQLAAQYDTQYAEEMARADAEIQRLERDGQRDS